MSFLGDETLLFILYHLFNVSPPVLTASYKIDSAHIKSISIFTFIKFPI